MERIKKSSKIGNLYLRLYEEAKATSVNQFYNKPSSAKIRIEEILQQKMKLEHGENYKVLCGNSYSFTAAWIVADGLRVETRRYSYLIH